MKQDLRSKKFCRNHNTLIIGIVCISLVIVLQVSQQGLNKNIILSIGVSGVFFLMLYLNNLLTYVAIQEDKTLVNKYALSAGFRTHIKKIVRIERSYEFILKSWGCFMVVHFINRDGVEQINTIQESIYNIQDIKDLLKTLTSINPSIHLHPQYQALIDGKIKHEEDFKKLRLEKKVK